MRENPGAVRRPSAKAKKANPAVPARGGTTQDERTRKAQAEAPAFDFGAVLSYFKENPTEFAKLAAQLVWEGTPAGAGRAAGEALGKGNLADAALSAAAVAPIPGGAGARAASAAAKAARVASEAGRAAEVAETAAKAARVVKPVVTKAPKVLGVNKPALKTAAAGVGATAGAVGINKSLGGDPVAVPRRADGTYFDEVPAGISAKLWATLTPAQKRQYLKTGTYLK